MRLPVVWLMGIGGSRVPAAHIFTVFILKMLFEKYKVYGIGRFHPVIGHEGP